MREDVAKALRGTAQDLPWWTWIAAFVPLHLATLATVSFEEGSYGFAGPAPLAVGILLVHWWGLRVLLPLYLNVLLCAPLIGLPIADAPMHALAATVVVFLSWLFFARLGDGEPSMPDIGEIVKFLLFGLLFPLAAGEIALQAHRLGSEKLALSRFWMAFGDGLLMKLLAGFALTVPALIVGSDLVRGRGWAFGEPRSREELGRFGRRLWERFGEAAILFGAALALALTAPLEQCWFLYGAILLGAALRFGAELAALSYSWVVLLVVALPAALSPGSGGGPIEAQTALGVLGIAALVTGRTVSDNLNVIERRTLAEAALRESEGRLRSIVQNMPVMVQAFDENGRIVAWNGECERVTGYPAAEILGNPEAMRILYPDESERARMLARSTGGEEDDWESTVVCKDGGRKTIGWSIVSAESPVPSWRAWGIGVDVTEWRAADEQLREYALKYKVSNNLLEARQLELEATNRALRLASGEAADANRAKSEFLANMSHEIRTPMTAILGFTDVLIDAEHDADTPVTRLEALQTIKRNGEYLLELINDILDLSKIEAGRLEIQNIYFSPAEAVEGVRSLMNVRAKAKNLTLAIRYETPIPETICGDPIRVKQILINLVGNAIKFTEVGGVRVIVRLLREGGPPMLCFEVIDTGIGMTSDQMERVFEPFSQADGSTTRRFGGTGLGLSICKRLCSMMGGSIEVESQRGAGSTFRAFLPTGDLEGVELRNPQEEPLSARSASARSDAASEREVRLDGHRILLAEDGPDNQRLVEHILTRVGAEITIAENGQIAVELATHALEESNPYDVILMDMQMPIVDGYLATQMLRRLGYGAPIIALTAHAMAGDRERCVEAGCDDFASKPIDRKELLEIVARYVGSAKKRRRKS